MACLAGAMACAGAPPPGPPQFADSDYPGVLRAPSALEQDVLWRQRVTATWSEGGHRSFDAVVQKRGDTLTVLSLSPLGTQGFAIQLHGDAIEVQRNLDEELPFPPRFILLDVQRVFYPWLAPPAGHDAAAPALDGERRGVVDGEIVVERWRDGQLVERQFRRVDQQPAGTIAISYEWGDPGETGAPRVGPRRAVLDNGWFGYQIAVDMQQEIPLPAEAAR